MNTTDKLVEAAKAGRCKSGHAPNKSRSAFRVQSIFRCVLEENHSGPHKDALRREFIKGQFQEVW